MLCKGPTLFYTAPPSREMFVESIDFLAVEAGLWKELTLDCFFGCRSWALEGTNPLLQSARHALTLSDYVLRLMKT